MFSIFVYPFCVWVSEQRGNTQANRTSEPLYVEAHSFILHYFISICLCIDTCEKNG